MLCNELVVIMCCVRMPNIQIRGHTSECRQQDQRQSFDRTKTNAEVNINNFRRAAIGPPSTFTRLTKFDVLFFLLYKEKQYICAA